MTAHVVVLNADFSYINIVSWRRAYNLIAKGKAEIIEGSDTQVRNYEGTKVFLVPAVIKLVEFIRNIYRAKVPFNKRNVHIRDNHTCGYCLITGPKMTIDHIVALARGGTTCWKNCITCCKKCNSIKGSKLLSQTNLTLKVKPYEPTIMQFLKLKFDILVNQKI